MIQFHADALWFRTPEGEVVPCSAETVALELSGDTGSLLDPEVVCHAAQAVLHYFKTDLGRSQVSVGEFAQTLATVLRGLRLTTEKEPEVPTPERVAEADLRRLACEAGEGFELVFFSRLRTELRQTLTHSPRMVRFRGLRACVKQLTGAGRWSPRCQRMNDQIVDYLRQCLSAEERSQPCSLVVV
jgi:hypothetical protein